MMKHAITFPRPATAAIAAALVFATSPALAQPADAPVDEAAQPAAPAVEPAPVAPAAEAAPADIAPAPTLPPVAQTVIPAPSQSTEVVQQTPATPVAAAPAEPQSAQRSAPARPAAPSAIAAPRAMAAQTPAATPVAPAETGTTPNSELAPVTEAAPVRATTQQPVDDSVLWALGGGALLLAGGIGAFALSRRKVEPQSERIDVAPVAVATPAPVAEQPAEVIFRPATEAPAMTLQPAIAPAAVAERMPHASDLEAMVAAQPSAENPFLTRKNRMRRAKYIMAHGMPEALHSDAEPVPVRVEEQQFRPQPAYRFSKAQNPPRFGWKPATS